MQNTDPPGEQGPPEGVSGQQEVALWEEFRRSGAPELRERLVAAYLDLTHTIAARLFGQRVNNSVTFDDYLQYARVGLLEAIDRFDPQRGASFATFAGYRIRGAILNGLERATEAAAQSAHRRRARLRERAQSLQPPQPNAAETGAARFAGLVDVTVLLAMGYVLEDSGHWNPGGADTASDPYRSVQLERLCSRLHRLVEVLPERERTIVQRHYFQQVEFQQIGELLGLSKGRVSQLHARALQLIREGYESLEGFDVEL
jgi:RNA polymerase sigma factor FliA